jgi:glutamyl-tRNA reductase
VRTQTDIGSASISMAAASVKLAERIFPSIPASACCSWRGRDDRARRDALPRQKPKSVTVANRTLDRGSKLADRFGAQAITLNELPQRLHEFDIVVTCTASTLPIIGKGLLERVVKQRKHAPVFIVDLGVPRDVEPQAADLDDVFLYSVDELQVIVRENLQVRQEAVVQAEAMIADQTEHFLKWLDGRSVVPTIEALSGHHDDIRSSELDRARRMLASGESPDAALDALARGLTSKLLHAPLSALNAANEAERAQLIAALSRVYRLDESKDGEP